MPISRALIIVQILIVQSHQNSFMEYQFDLLLKQSTLWKIFVTGIQDQQTDLLTVAAFR